MILNGDGQWVSGASRRVEHAYLAGPFFNDPQRRRFERLEAMFRSSGIPYYSPREESVARGFKIENPEQADQALANDVQNLERCTLILAQLDYALEPGDRLALMHDCFPREDGTNPHSPVVKVPSITLPDTGTVWELGWGYAQHRPSYGIYTGSSPLNIMLARTLDGVFRSFEEVSDWLNGGAAPCKWEGRMV